MKKIVVIGSLNVDFVVNVKEMPLVGETLLASGFELIPGGKGANQSYALGKLGADVSMLGVVGDDAYAKMLLTSLQDAGVDISHIKTENGVSTGIALINVNQRGDNSIIVVQGANKCVTKEYIDCNLDLIKTCDIVIFQLEIPIETVVYAAEIAKKYGKTVILDPAPAPGPLPESLLRNVDIIKPNETELSILTGIEHAENHLKEASDLLKSAGVGCVMVTMGGKGVYVNPSEGAPCLIECDKVEVVDTTAAGDSFTAAVAVSLIHGKDILAAAAYANKVASLVVTRKGAQSSIPTLAEVEEFINRN